MPIRYIIYALFICISVAMAGIVYLYLRKTEFGSEVKPKVALPIVVEASSSREKHDPDLVLDGRSFGSLPFDWQAKDSDSNPFLEITIREPLPIIGFAVHYSTPSNKPTQLQVNSKKPSCKLYESAVDAVWVFNDTITVKRITVTTKRAVARVELLYDGTQVWLIDKEGEGDYVNEFLFGYGLRFFGRLSSTIPKAINSLVKPGHSIILTNTTVSDQIRDVVTDLLKKGVRVVELGPSSGICGSYERPSGENHHRLRPTGSNRNIRWVGPLTKQLPISDSEETKVLFITQNGEPVLVQQKVGMGLCYRWLSDFQESIRRLRQGNPDFANKDSNGREGFQPSDLFKSDLNENDYSETPVDYLIEKLIAILNPPFRLHSLPSSAASILIMTADQDYVPDQGVLAQSDAASSAGFTAMLTHANFGAPPDVSFGQYSVETLSVESIRELLQRGHEIGIHPNLYEIPQTKYRSVIQQQVRAFRKLYGQSPQVVRNHHLVWSGYTHMAILQAEAGLELNLDFMGQSFKGEGALGYLNGSGYPMRFVTVQGEVLPIMQQGTQLDDHVLLPPRFGYRHYSVRSFLEYSSSFLDVASRDVPRPITLNHHPSWWYETKGRLQEGIFRLAKSKNIPVWGAKKWLNHIKSIRNTVLSIDEKRLLYILTADTEVSLLRPTKSNRCVKGRLRNLGAQTYCWEAIPKNRNYKKRYGL